MVARLWVVVVLLGSLASMGAQHRTRNFVVEAPTPQLAERVGQWAEYYRKQKAIQWLGKEMPDWGRPCPLDVRVTYGGSGGATSFAFADNGSITSIDMRIEGTVDRLIASVLPHEVTHTVLAYYFRVPVPRWADEGGSVLSEDEQERNRHEVLVRQILNAPGRAIPLSRLFQLTQYPRDVMVLYAEGYSVANFLVGRSGRPAFLAFIADGMRTGWDRAVQTHYSFRSVNELEQAWMQHLREIPRPSEAIASAGGHRPAVGPASATAASRVVVRQTLPPAVPVLGAPRPVARGVAGSSDTGNTRQGPPDGFARPSAAPPSGSPFMGTSADSSIHIGTPRPAESTPAWNRPVGNGSPVGYSP
jgi:hypothetical protein